MWKSRCQGVDAQKLCFCEAPASREPWRFGQEREIPTFLGRCPGPLKQIDRGKYKKDLNALIQVGRQVVAVPSHWDRHVKPSRSDAVLILDLDTHRHGSVLNTGEIQTLAHSEQLAVINGAVYGIAANFLLVIAPCRKNYRPLRRSEQNVLLHDVSLKCNLIHTLLGTCLCAEDTISNATRKLGNSSWFEHSKYFGLVADEQKLYLTPLQGKTCLMVDVRAETFTEIEIPGKWQSKARKWSNAVIAAGKVFACPFKPGLPMLVWSLDSLENPEFRGIDLPERVTYGDMHHGLVVFEGLLYTAPRSANNIWVINASSEEIVAKINVVDFIGSHSHSNKFLGAAVVGRAIAFAPHDTSCLLILAVDTRELGCIGLNIYNGIRSGGVMAAGNQVWLFPRENQDITVVDMVTNTSEADEGYFPIPVDVAEAKDRTEDVAKAKDLAHVVANAKDLETATGNEAA